MITHLEPNEVFVFGSNLQGFHGAGSAGYAMRGDARNNWRSDDLFLDIMYNRARDRRGRWAVFGICRGFQVGMIGKSYAIPTVESPGLQGKVNEDYFLKELREFIQFTLDHPELRFLVVKLGANRSEGGYSYLGLETVAKCFQIIRDDIGIPQNVVLPEQFL